MKNRVLVLSLLCLLFSFEISAQSPTNLEEQYELGRKYYNGDGVKKNHKEAANLWKMAAEQNHTLSQIALGELYMKGGKGIKKDINSAEFWLKKAANNGNALAQDYMGLIYEVGYKDPMGAIPWYQKAANQGNEHSKAALRNLSQLPTDPDEQFRLGIKYHNGDGVKMDYKLAVYWLEQAAKQKEVRAQGVLGWIYMSGGGGVKRDLAKSEYWFKKAIEQGNPIVTPMAQFGIGYLYEVWKNNKGVAIYWYQKAADQGNEDAIGRLYKLRGGY